VKGILQQTKDSCCPACIASIFEIPIEDVPALPDNDTWIEVLNQWLSQFGLYSFSVTFAIPEQREVLRGYTLGGIKSKNFAGKNHCVVCYDGKIVWDPLYGEQDGTEYPDTWEVFITKDPKVMMVNPILQKREVVASDATLEEEQARIAAKGPRMPDMGVE